MDSGNDTGETAWCLSVVSVSGPLSVPGWGEITLMPAVGIAPLYDSEIFNDVLVQFVSELAIA